MAIHLMPSKRDEERIMKLLCKYVLFAQNSICCAESPKWETLKILSFTIRLCLVYVNNLNNAFDERCMYTKAILNNRL
jgi:hypothetical protein